MLDACRTAGGLGPNDPGINPTTDNLWAIASGIVTPTGSSLTGRAFFGWDGDASQVVYSNHAPSDWFVWRTKFLYALGQQYSIMDAATYATQHYTRGSSAIQPYDSLPNTVINRLQVMGDPLTALP